MMKMSLTRVHNDAYIKVFHDEGLRMMVTLFFGMEDELNLNRVHNDEGHTTQGVLAEQEFPPLGWVYPKKVF